MEPERLVWIGFFLMWPMMFFSDYLKTTSFYHVFGILTLIAAGIMIYSFVMILQKRKKRK
jgi:hypothetical protein